MPANQYTERLLAQLRQEMEAELSRIATSLVEESTSQMQKKMEDDFRSLRIMLGQMLDSGQPSTGRSVRRSQTLLRQSFSQGVMNIARAIMTAQQRNG